MIRLLGLGTIASLLVSFLYTGCVTTGTFDAKVAEMNKAMEDQQAADKKLLDETSADLTAQKKACEDKLGTTLSQKQILEAKLTSMGQNVDQLLKEKGSLAQEIEELRRMRAAAEARNADFRSLLEKFRKMIDAGTLQLKVRNGRMVVQMQSDVLFASGSAQLKPEAKAAITEVANTIKSLPERRFQVVGHSDSTPIVTARFPSNWELSSQRAIEVVKLMVEAGVPSEMISGAGSAEFDPIAPNDSAENKAQNRRVEIVFMPKIDELPGFDNILKSK
jgi:chemotaxis protein MotB